MTYPQKNDGLLLLQLFILLLFNTFAHAEITSRSQNCFTISDCKDELDDPWEGFNRSVFKFNDFMDYYILKPISEGYVFITPNLIQRGVSNFFRNLKEPITGINALFQKKGNISGISLTRFLINSTIGLFGFLDVAGTIGIESFDEDFGQTLAYWGVESGPYLVLPFLGPSTIRGTAGSVVDWSLSPLTDYSRGDDGTNTPYTDYTNKNAHYATPMQGMLWIDRRASFLDKEKALSSSISDKYEFFRTVYFQNRKFKIYDGKVPVNENQNTGKEEQLEEELEELLD